MKIAIAVMDAVLSANTECSDDWAIKRFLESNGVAVDIIDWRSPEFDCKEYDSILVSSTWNLHHFPEEFMSWLDRCESDGKKKLINDIEIIKLGINKDRYITLLAEKFGYVDLPTGSIIPSIFIKNTHEEHKPLSEILGELREQSPSLWAGDLVIKPITSADGDNTYHLTQCKEQLETDSNNCRSFAEGDTLFEQIVTKPGTNGVIVQPFINAVERKGEYQLVFIGGKYSHATVKSAGFKNHDFSARKPLTEYELPTKMLEFANNIMAFLSAQYPGKITRARIDLFAGENGPVLCEVEMVEPNTNILRLPLEQQKEVVQRYATAIQERTLALSNEAHDTTTLVNGAGGFRYNIFVENKDAHNPHEDGTEPSSTVSPL